MVLVIIFHWVINLLYGTVCDFLTECICITSDITSNYNVVLNILLAASCEIAK